MTTQHNTCSTCFVPTRFPGIQIENNGKCSLCNSNIFGTVRKARTTSNITELHRIAEQLKKKRYGQYDCVIGASGGLDSSYVIYVAKKVLDLNPLVVSYDYGFTYDITKNNLKTICKELKVDLRFIHSAQEYDRKYIKSMVRALSTIDIYWGVCAFCHYVLPAAVYHCALKEKTFFILTSSNVYEQFLHVHRGVRSKFTARALLKSGIWKLPKILLHMAVAYYYLLRLKLEFYVPPIINIFLPLPKSHRLKKVNITKYVRWDVDTMAETLQKEVGWKTPEHPKLPMRFDCEIEESLINYTYKQTTGMTVHGIICNNLIYDGVRTKSKLKDTVDYYDGLVKDKKEELMIRLGLK